MVLGPLVDSHVKKIVEFFAVLKGCHRAKEAVCGSTQIHGNPAFFCVRFHRRGPEHPLISLPRHAQ